MIDIMVLGTNYSTEGIIDTYESLLWTDRFNQYGDFELYTPFDYSIIQLCEQEKYLAINNSLYNMIIEDIEIKTDSETGQHIIIKGRSLESILDRRIIWTQTTVSGNLILAVNKILSQAIIKPSISDRKIDNFYIKKPESNFVDSSGNPFKLDKTQFTGDNIYDILQQICESFEIGYRILFGYQMKKIYSGNIDIWNANNSTWTSTDISTMNDFDMIFELYLGYDRSYDADTNSGVPYVVFSPDFDNIINTDYLDSTNVMKNVTLVMGEEQGSTRKRLVVGSGSGLTRRELYTDARDLRSDDYSSPEDYEAALKQRGTEKLYENSRITSYEGEVEAFRSFIYGEDFYMGDVVQISNEFGIHGKARVIEWVRSESDTGVEVYPTFSGIQIIDTTTHDDDEPEDN